MNALQLIEARRALAAAEAAKTDVAYCHISAAMAGHWHIKSQNPKTKALQFEVPLEDQPAIRACVVPGVHGSIEVVWRGTKHRVKVFSRVEAVQAMRYFREKARKAAQKR